MRNQESQGPVEAQRVAWGRLSGAGSMKTLRLQRDPDGFFLWHPDYAPWIVGRRSPGANPSDRAFFDPSAGEIVWSSRDGIKDYEMDELVARHLLVSSWRCPSLRASGRLRTGSSSARREGRAAQTVLPVAPLEPGPGHG
jgi:hypothetical protein